LHNSSLLEHISAEEILNKNSLAHIWKKKSKRGSLLLHLVPHQLTMALGVLYIQAASKINMFPQIQQKFRETTL